ncbi:uncharacterized protein LOC130960156 [Arachis stenosperma]|uniref:uncharacterized protein LOC130960156 n=1 Tax=Arachis stenosperma TaxID=217475 RepID=UPI0025ABECC1|nr:uncharacterized protein LOC130960156 [Arachis stenosperma]
MSLSKEAEPTLGYLTHKDTEVKLPRPTRVKNKTPALIQITAEQILREARERQEAEIRPPKQKITDPTELGEYRLRKRKEFEDLIRRVRWNIGVWIKYAEWEESQKDLKRARSVWERALEVDYKNHTLWLKYAEMEMKNKFINHARNVWDRAVTLLPRVDQLWYKYIHMEEMLGNVAGARQVFERWMKYVAFEKQYGDREGIEDAIVGKRRFQYEDEVRKNPLNYDSWFDYIRLEESVGNKERIREVYERAIANVPPAEVKRFWQRYIYLWINYALYEELDAEDVDPTRDVYRKCLNLIPHSKFSFAKIWLLAAQFEIRQLNLKGARQILGNAIGKAPKDKIFNKYIEIELQLGNIDRCRKLYEKYLEWSPQNCYAWSKYAELERSLSETDRARAIFELAIAQPALDMPELLWKAYIDFETAEGEFERARVLYERLLNRTKHLKVWISYAEFEAQNSLDLREEEQKRECLQRARRVFEEEREMLLEKWLNMEAASGEVGDVNLVQSKLPKKLKKRRQVTSEDGSARIEEFIDYLFPEEIQTTNLKILEAFSSFVLFVTCIYVFK